MTRRDRLYAARNAVLDRDEDTALIDQQIAIDDRRILAYERANDPVKARLDELALRVGQAIAPAPHWTDEWRVP